jgi:hypothetical protein
MMHKNSSSTIRCNQEGDIIEALGSGVQQRNISVYRQTEYHVVHLEDVVDINRVHEVQFAQVLNGEPCGLVQTDAFEAAWTDEGARRPFHPHSYFLAVGGNTPIKRRYNAASA